MSDDEDVIGEFDDVFVTDTIEDDGIEAGDETSSSPKTIRDDVWVKLDYGTKMFPEDSDCEECEEKADGVVVERLGNRHRSLLDEYQVLCGDCYNSLYDDPDFEWRDVEWHEFEEVVEE